MMKHCKIYWLVWLLLAAGCYREVEFPGVPGRGESLESVFSAAGVVDGVVRIKVDRETAQALQGAPTKGGARRDAFEALRSRFDIVRMERVFPADAHEAKTREAGLDLWYHVYVGEKKETQMKVAEALAGMQGVVRVEPALKLKRQGGGMVAGRLPAWQRTGDEGDGTQVAYPFDDPYLPLQWNFRNGGTVHAGARAGADINLFPVWKEAVCREDVVVAVIDEGVQYDHPDLAANMWEGIGYNFCDNSRDITWGGGHGTHVAGVIAAVNGNGIGVGGIAGGSGHGDGVKIMTCEIYDPEGEEAYDFVGARAMKYAADNGAVISQNSWGYEAGAFGSEEEFVWKAGVMKEAIDYFITYAGRSADGKTQTGPMAGGVVIFAAGNEGSGTPAFPGAYSKCINVGAVACNYEAAWYTNYGETVDICAPGGGEWYSLPGNIAYAEGFVLSTLPTTLKNGDKVEGKVVDYVDTTGYGYMQGTSMACPHVSGVAALLVSKFGGPGFTNDELRNILLNTTRSVDEWQPQPYAGALGGLVDVQAAFDYYNPGTPFPKIVAAEGQEDLVRLLDYETVELKYTLQNYTGFSVSDTSGVVAFRQEGDEVTLTIPGRRWAPGKHVVVLTARNRAKTAELELQCLVEENVAPELVRELEMINFSDINLSSELVLTDYFKDANGDLESFRAGVTPKNKLKVSVADSVLHLGSVAKGECVVRVQAKDKGGLVAEAEFEVVVNERVVKMDFFPNPCHGELHIRAGMLDGEPLTAEAEVKVLNTTGTEVLRRVVRFEDGEAGALDVSALKAGRYLLEVSFEFNGRRMSAGQTLLKY